MSVLGLPGRRAAIIAAVCVLAAGAAAAWIATRGDAPASEKPSTSITVATGGALERHGLATVRIPPHAISGDAVLRVVKATGAVPDPDPVFSPVGAAVTVAVNGASPTAPFTLELPVTAPAARAGRPPFAPLAMYLDQAGGGWVPVASAYDRGKAAVVARTTQLSTWRAFAWDWRAAGDTTADLVTGAFGDRAPAQVAPPDCARQQEAEAVARSQVTPAGHLPSCLDLDASGGLLLRVVNDRPFAIQVQQLDGVELAERQQQPPSSAYGATVIANWIAVAAHFRLAVLGPGEGATFRVTSLARPTGITTTPTTLSYVTDVLDLGVGELAWMFGALGGPAAGDKAGLYDTLFAGGDLSACVSAGIDEKPGGATGAASGGLAGIVSDAVFGCLAEETSAHPPTDLPAPAFAGSLVAPGLGVVADQLAEGKYLDDLLSGADTVSVQLTPA